MKFTHKITSSLAATFAMLTGCFWISAGAMQLTAGDQIRGETVDNLIAHLSLGVMAAALLLAIPALLKLSTLARSPRGAYLAIGGQVILATAATTSNIVGYDPTFFMVAAPLGNLLWLAGSIWLAVSLSKAGAVPRWVAIGLPLVQIVSLPLAAMGGGIIAGAWWIATGLFLNEDQAVEMKVVAE